MIGLKSAGKLVLLSAFATIFSLPVLSRAEAPTSKPLSGHVHTTAHPEIRVTSKVDDSKRMMLMGHLPSALRRATDEGRLDPSTPAEHLILVLKSSEQQKHELRRVIDEQQDKDSKNYHQWVTPEEFGGYFGVHDSDIAQVNAWLSSHGFKVEDVSKSKRVLHFTGTTGQLERAFHTEMHIYNVRGERHVSNNSEISIPTALSDVISGVRMNNFFSKSRMSPIKKVEGVKKGPHVYGGACTGTAESTCNEFVGPGDFATIYNTQPLLNAGINGAGVKIGVVGRSDILMSDVEAYRNMFGLPNNDPIFVHAGQDNGIEPGDDGESDLDVELSGGYAPGAQVYFVVGTPTFFVDGITNSYEYLIENNLTDIISSSYGDCESNEGTGGNAFNNQAFEQAAAQGISIFIANGDNGPAQCDDQSADTYEVLGYAAPAESSSPYAVAVGGTAFNEGATANPSYTTVANNALYWSTGSGPELNNALLYIPEIPWNGAKNSDASLDPKADIEDLWSASGAVSAYYTRPAYQAGDGVPSGDPTLAGGNWVVGINITNGGSGYVTAPTVTFGTGCTTAPAATSTLTAGVVTSINFNYGTQGGTLKGGQGFNCTTAPTITLTAAPAGGTTAVAAVSSLGPMQNILPLVSGVPHRLTPDLSLAAEVEHDGSVFCSEGGCENPSPGSYNFDIVGGTSVAAPSMAGVQALIDQANGGRQGMPNYIYYTLAAQQSLTGCNSNILPSGAGASTGCAFQDITVGDNYICATSACSGTGTTSKIGFPAGAGFDLATGLGTPNVANLSALWSTVRFNSSDTTLGLSKTTGIAQGSAVTLSGTVTAGSGNGTPSGDVAFILSKGEFGQAVNVNTQAFNGPSPFATISGGAYTATLENLPAGTYTVTARYAGDEVYGSSLSTPVTITVGTGTATVAITPQNLADTTSCSETPTSTYTYGQFAWIPATVTPNSGAGVPTGTVTFTVDGTPYATETLDEQGAGYLAAGAIYDTSCLYDYMFAQSPTLTAGTHSIGATYSGDSTFPSAQATPVIVTVSKLSVTPTLAAGATFITSGTSEQLTATFATVSAITSGLNTGSAAPTGSVIFTDTTTSAILGTVAVVPTVTFTGGNYPEYTYAGTAVLTTAGITASGAHSITATYQGDVNYLAKASTAVTVTVQASAAATSVAVTSSANPTTLGGRPTFTATLTPSTIASGTVTFYDGTTVLGTGTVAAGKATLKLGTTPAFGGGAHNITAIYGGIAATSAITSPVFVENVTLGTTTVVLTAKNAEVYGQAISFAALITPSSAGSTYTPNHSATLFYDCPSATPCSTVIGTGVAQTVSADQGGYAVWNATSTVTTLTVGTHYITAAYSDANYSSSTSNSQVVVVSPASLTVTANPASKTAGSANPAFTATISGFVNGDTSSVVSGAPAFSTTATVSSPAGAYPIVPSMGTLAASNYTFTFVNGVLSVTNVPTVSLTTILTVSGSASTGYSMTVTISNTGTGTATSVMLNTATLNGVAGSVPVAVGSIAGGTSAHVMISYPGSTGADNAKVVGSVSGTYTGGTFSATQRVTLP